MNARGATTAVVATAAIAHRQRSATMTAVPPPGAGPEATLEVVRQLLDNPIGAHASPSTVEQWHHDVDQLVVTAINTPSHGGRKVSHLGGAPVLSVTHLR
jgi:hypothetical protein